MATKRPTAAYLQYDQSERPGVVKVLNLYVWCFGIKYDPNRKACLGCNRAPDCREATKKEEPHGPDHP